MVPQQAHYQFRWLKCVRAHLGLSICPARNATRSDAGGYLLFAICYSALTQNLIDIPGADGVPGDPGVYL